LQQQKYTEGPRASSSFPTVHWRCW